MNSYDAIIVGAGPAGSTCAGRLNQSGLRVKLLDKKVFPRVKPCAGWITPQVVDALQINLTDYQTNKTLQPITGFRTGILGGRIIETNYPHPVSFGIRRSEFDDYLLRRSGVNCEYESVKQIKRAGNDWQINGRYSAPLLIGAGGHFCPVARFARRQNESPDVHNSQNSNSVVVYAQEVEFEMSVEQRQNEHLHPEKPELYFCRDLLGYGWCFRKGAFLNVGLGRTDKSALAKHVQQFCDFLRSHKKLVGELPPNFLGHAYKLYADLQPLLFDDGLLLVGDAAGLAYPQSGEGIRPAVESALIAADVIVRANHDYGKDALSSYASRVVERFGEVKPLRTVRWLPVAWLQNIAAGLMATHWFAKNVVVENWFLNRRQSAMNVQSQFFPTTERRVQ